MNNRMNENRNEGKDSKKRAEFYKCLECGNRFSTDNVNMARDSAVYYVGCPKCFSGNVKEIDQKDVVE